MLPTCTIIPRCAMTGFSILPPASATLVPMLAMAELMGRGGKDCPVEHVDRPLGQRNMGMIQMHMHPF